MLPVFSDRQAQWPSHPYATRDSLHEAEMWAVEGLTHRYPTKVLAELVPTCPQYCGHCTRMDLVGNPTPSYDKHRFTVARDDRLSAMLSYLRSTPSVRDVVVSGGDVANLPWPRVEAFVAALLEIDSVRDIRLASKALMGLPQHWLSADVLAGMTRLAATARSRGVSLAVHTHVNAAQSVTPLVARAARALLDAGVRDVRNQGVLLRGVNDSPGALLDLCFALLDGAGVTPYYFYLCDMIPGAEHWRLTVGEATGAAVGDHGLPARVRDAAHGLRRPVRRQALGPPGIHGTTRNSASRTGRRATGPRSRPTTRWRSSGSTPTTTRCTCCPRRDRPGGAAQAPAAGSGARAA